MEISEVRVKLVGNPTDRLKAFASVTLDGDFVIRDIKVIDGTDGVFVAMPSRKLADRCPKCRCKNHLRAKYCNECGAALRKGRVPRDNLGRSKLHADIAHPINTACRRRLQEQIVEAYKTEFEQSSRPGYKPAPDDDIYDDETDVEAGTAVDTEPALDADAPDGGYNDLIADLKRDAAQRRDSRRRSERAAASAETKNTVEPDRAAAEQTLARPTGRQADPPGDSATAPAEEIDDFGAGII